MFRRGRSGVCPDELYRWLRRVRQLRSYLTDPNECNTVKSAENSTLSLLKPVHQPLLLVLAQTPTNLYIKTTRTYKIHKTTYIPWAQWSNGRVVALLGWWDPRGGTKTGTSPSRSTHLPAASPPPWGDSAISPSSSVPPLLPAWPPCLPFFGPTSSLRSRLSLSYCVLSLPALVSFMLSLPVPPPPVLRFLVFFPPSPAV